jgi:hypothetical protein
MVEAGARKAATPFQRDGVPLYLDGRHVEIMLIDADYRQALVAARDALPKVEALKPASEGDKRIRNIAIGQTHRQIAWASYNLKDYATAEKEMRRALESMERNPAPETYDKIELSGHRILLAAAIARQGRAVDAKALVEPELKFHRDLAARGSEDVGQHESLATALLVMAYASPRPLAHAYANEAAGILDKLPAEERKRKTVMQIRAWVAEEAAKAS